MGLADAGSKDVAAPRAESLVVRDPGDSLGRFIERGDAPLRVDSEDAVVHAVEDGLCRLRVLVVHRDGSLRSHRVRSIAAESETRPLYLGAAVLSGSITPFLVVLVFPVFMDTVFIRLEEAKLAQTFGDAWMDYTARVRRWI